MTGDPAADGGSVASARGDGVHRASSLPDRPVERASTLPSLSVVVVTYNEEDRIEACLDSVLDACRNDPTVQVILVDSNSTDRTVELARQYPVRILRITDDDLTTPGAGRYVGQRVATGEQILFVDGDMCLSEGWLDGARAIVARPDDVAGVDGHLNSADASTVEPVEALRGVALYDADALDRVDGFDPYLLAVEDIELGYRITAAGYEVERLPTVAASHPFSVGWSELRRRWHNGYCFAIGQAVRKNVRSPRIVRKLLVRYRYSTLYACWLVLGIVALFEPVLAVGWLATSLSLFAADVAWEGLAGAVHRLGKYTLLAVGFVPGFLIPPRDPEDFPLESIEHVDDPDAGDC